MESLRRSRFYSSIRPYYLEEGVIVGCFDVKNSTFTSTNLLLCDSSAGVAVTGFAAPRLQL
jgi:hypothetical protein